MTELEAQTIETEETAPTMEETMGAVFDRLNGEDDAADAVAGTEIGTEGSEAPPADSPPMDGTDDAVTPPASWSAEEKAEFEKLPTDVARAVLRRETDRERAFQSKTETLAEQRRQYDAVEAAIGPHRSSLRRQGMSDADAVRYLVAAHEWLEREPSAAIAWLSQRYMHGNASHPPTLHSDGVAASQQAPAGMPGDHLHGHSAQAIADGANAWPSGLSEALRTFASDRNDAGEPTYPHYAAVIADMVPLIQSSMRHTPHRPYDVLVKDAYEQALWRRDDLRESILEAARQEGRQTAEAEARQRSAKARKASSVNLPGSGAPAKRELRGRTMEETMARVYDQLNGT